MKATRMLPPVYLIASIVITALIHFLLPVMEFAPYPWNLIGIVPLGLGVVFNLMADAAFKRVQTTVKPFEISSALVTNGIFRISRNPMYLGMLLLLLGIAILLGSLAPLLIVIIFGVLMELVFVRTEQKMLEEKFGSEWTDYRTKVRKWL